jgi:hypothetical protein
MNQRGIGGVGAGISVGVGVGRGNGVVGVVVRGMGVIVAGMGGMLGVEEEEVVEGRDCIIIMISITMTITVGEGEGRCNMMSFLRMVSGLLSVVDGVVVLGEDMVGMVVGGGGDIGKSW